MKLLFIYNNPLDGSYGGSQRTKQALFGLKQNFDVTEYSCIKKSNKFATLFRNICGYSGNLSSSDCKNILNILKKEKIDFVYLDVSLHGVLVRKIKKQFPSVKVIVNYHNCEAKYFGDMYKTRGLPYYPIYKSAVKNEKLSVKNADFHIFITNEDREELNVSENCCLIPVTLKDCFEENEKESEKDNYLLFIGASQYANVEAVKYIIEKLAPKTDKKFLIVGKGMKSIFPNDYRNVEVRDFVESLNDIFKNASAFISPLFYGSGAKVKVAEALMHGKKIIGTSLSFFGYEMDGASFSVCDSDVDFLNEIENLDMKQTFFLENRKLFLEKYCDSKNGEYYSQILKRFGEIK